MFEAKVAWLRALAIISSEERKALEALNETRNKLAHITKPGAVPELHAEDINKLRAALAPTMSELMDDTATDSAQILRNTVIAIVVLLYVRGEVAEPEFGIPDIARYHLTGETVQQRIDTARRLSEDDEGHDLRSAKELVRVSSAAKIEML